jgi:hypothetical protein
MDMAAAIGRVEELCGAIDVPVDGWPAEAVAVLGIGLRGVGLARELVDLASKGTPQASMAAAIIERPLVDLAITARWIEASPELHVRLWLAEDERNRLTLDDRYGEFNHRRDRSPVPRLGPVARAEMHKRIQLVRAAGLRAGVPIPEKKGALIPSLEERAKVLGYAYWEAYEIAFRGLSPWTHTSVISLVNDRLEQRADGTHLVPGPPHGSEPTKEAEEEREHLSAIIEVLNDRFGLKLGTADQLFFDQLEATWLDNEHLVAQARANPIENFRLVFNDVFIKSIVGRMDDNEDLFKKILDEPAFQAAVMDHYLRRVFERARTEQLESP